MRKIFAFVFLMTLSLNSFGQITNEKQIYGKWKVQKIFTKNIEKSQNPQFKTLIDAFKTSTFSFNPSGNFQLSSTTKSELFGMIIEMTTGTKWKFEKNKQFVKIGNEKDEYSIMGISIREINGKKMFHLDEHEMTLEMKKLK